MAASPNVFEVPSEASSDTALQPEGFAIRLPSAQLADLIQINCLNRVRGAFRVSSGPHQGHLFFDQGRLVHADFGEVVGLDAVVVMLGWRGGSIEPCLRPWPNESSIGMGADSLLLHAAQRLDEMPMRSGDLADATTKVVRRVQLSGAASLEAELGETRRPRRVSPNIDEGPNARTPILPVSTRPSPAGDAAKPGTDLRHGVLVPPVEQLASEARASQVEVRAALGGSLSQLQIVQVALDGTIQQLKSGASTELADTAFFCHRVAGMIGQTLGLGECRALSFESKEEGIVVFKGRSIVGARGMAPALDFIVERVGLK